MRRRAFLLEGARAAAGVALLPLVTSAIGADAEVQIPELERVISQLMKDAAVPGVAIAVIKDAKLVWRQGFGVKDRASRAPVDDRTVFEVASVSKTVFAYSAMMLCEKAVIGLHTPLDRIAAVSWANVSGSELAVALELGLELGASGQARRIARRVPGRMCEQL